MQTRLLYQTDSYLCQFAAEVVALDESAHGVTIDQTAFYPGGGGQPSDRGSLMWNGGRVPLTGIQRTPNGIVHLLDASSPLPMVRTEVHGEVDWTHRYQLMRTHTAMHILCGVVFRDYGALVTGGDMEPLKGRMDFEFENLQKELILEIQTAVNREIVKAHPLRVEILPREQAFQIPDLIRTKINLLPEGIPQVRVVEIVGLDLQADGGTHVKNTSEVGGIKVVDYKSKGKINKRIYVEVVDLPPE
jgi:misacylated tRNA(Ala) deacylase